MGLDKIVHSSIVFIVFISTVFISEPCTDFHDNCYFWASIGECDRNAGWMHAYCRLACGICTDQGAVGEKNSLEINLYLCKLAYTELQGGFNMLQLISADSGHFTLLHIIKEPSLWQYQVRIWACPCTTIYPKGSLAVVD